MTFADQSISAFLDDVASPQVTPSGGAVVAVGGAMGGALCEMVCIHTTDKDEYADVSAELADARDALCASRAKLLELADEDASAVDELQTAFKRDAGTEQIQTAAKRSTEIPLATAETCLDVLEAGVIVAEKGNQNAVADALAGVWLAHAALKASISTVRANLDLLEDEGFVERMEQRTAEIEAADETVMASLDQ